MATYSKPTTIPRWADTSVNIVEPAEAKKDEGWTFGEIPPSSYENWRTKLNGEWWQWLNERFADGTTNNDQLSLNVEEFGVGVADPQYKLHVRETQTTGAGSKRIALFDVDVAGTSRGLSLWGTDDLSSGCAIRVENTGATLHIENNAGTRHVSVLDTGFFGLGNETPQHQLHVKGASDNLASFESTDALAFICLADSGSTSLTHVRLGSVSDEMVFYAGNAEVARFTDDGRFGLGTTNPVSTIEAVGLGTTALRIHSDATSATSSIEIGTGGSGDRISFIDLVTDDGFSDYGLRIIRNAGANNGAAILHKGTGDFQITTEEPAAIQVLTSSTIRMTVEAAGNVGIGETSPDARLHVRDTAVSGSVLAGSSMVIERNANNFLSFLTANGSYGGLSFSDPVNGAHRAAFSYQGSTDSFLMRAEANDFLQFERFRIFPLVSGGVDLGASGSEFDDLFINTVYLSNFGSISLGSTPGRMAMENGKLRVIGASREESISTAYTYGQVNLGTVVSGTQYQLYNIPASEINYNDDGIRITIAGQYFNAPTNLTLDALVDSRVLCTVNDSSPVAGRSFRFEILLRWESADTMQSSSLGICSDSVVVDDFSYATLVTSDKTVKLRATFTGTAPTIVVKNFLVEKWGNVPI